MLQYCFCFLFWFFGQEACRILAPRPGIKPGPSALEGEVLATGLHGSPCPHPPLFSFLSKGYYPLPVKPLRLCPLKVTFPDSSVGKASACNAGDPGSIPGLGRSAGEGIGYPLQCSWASLVAQLVKNPPAMWETWVLCLGWEDSLEKGKATHSSMLAGRLPWTV